MIDKKFVSSNEMRRLEAIAEKRFGIRSLILMENAGRSVAEIALKIFPSRKGSILICCGPGNNGGDGFVAARHLDNRERRIEVLFFGRIGRLKDDAKENLRILRRMRIPFWINPKPSFIRRKLRRASGVIDALFGTGLKRLIGEPYLGLIRLINRSRRRILSIDIPSGLDADHGRSWGDAVQADVTVALGYAKKGFRGPGKRWVGDVILGDISLPRRIR